MRPFTLACLALLLIALSASAEIDTMWTKTIPDFNGNAFEFTGACGLADNGFALCGFVYDENFYQDIIVARVDGQGNLLWINDYGEIYTEDPWAILEADDGSLRIFFSQYADSFPYLTLRMMAIGANGDSLWTESYIGLNEYGRRSATKTSDGCFVVVADSNAEVGNNLCSWMMKVDAAGTPLWSRSYDIGGWSYGRRVIESADGSLLLTGDHYPSDSTWQSYLFVIRTNSSGVLTWTESYSIPTMNGNPGWGGQILGLAETNSGDFFVSGVTGGWEWWNAGFLMKFEGDGDHLWSNNPDDFVGKTFAGVAPEPDGGCSIVGAAMPIEVGSYYPFIQEFEALGTAGEFWQPSLTQNYGLSGACSASNGGHLAYGYCSDAFGAARGGYIIRMGPNTVVSGHVTDVEHNLPLRGVRVTVDFDHASDLTDTNGDYFISTSAIVTDILFSGPCITPDTLESQALIQGQVNVRDFSVGVPDYARSPSSVNLAIRYDIEQTFTVTLGNPGSGNLAFTAIASPETPTYNWLVVSPTEGILAPGESRDLILTILADSEQGTDIDFFGTIRVWNHSCPDSIDTIPISAIAMDAEEQPGGTVREFALHPAFPNPFNAVTQLRFDLPSPGQVQLNLFDISGRLVRTLVGEQMTAGSHSISIDMADAASGVYIAHLQSGSMTASRKIVLLK